MNVILFGYGKMGKNIYKALKKNQNIKEIYVVDPAFTDEQVVEHQYKSLDEIPSEMTFEASFIASNSITHADVLEQTIKKGIKNIFCEKPMCLSQEEYDRVFKILPSDSRIVVDYLLRSSKALHAFQEKFEDLSKAGYVLTSCNIDYGKDKTKDPRRFKDIGVYEELYHVWDLMFNGPLFGKIKDVHVEQNVYTPDPEIPGRCIQQRFKYKMIPENGQTFNLNLNSSFQKDSLERSFICFFSKGKDRKVLSLVFDKNGQDKCIMVHNHDQVEAIDFQANVKLDNIITDSLNYFKTGTKAHYFHEGKDSVNFHKLIVKLKQVKPLQKDLILNRIKEHRTI